MLMISFIFYNVIFVNFVKGFERPSLWSFCYGCMRRLGHHRQNAWGTCGDGAAASRFAQAVSHQTEANVHNLTY